MIPMLLDNPDLVTLGALAQALGARRKALRDFVVGSGVPHAVIGDALIFNRAAVEAALARLATGIPAQPEITAKGRG